MGDINMDVAHIWAKELGPCPDLPDSISDPRKRAKFLDKMDKYFGEIADIYRAPNNGRKSEFLRQISGVTKDDIPDVVRDLDRVNLTFRLWSGCLWVAKTIALETRSGPNTVKERERQFKENINPRAQVDPIFRAGVESAKYFKERRNQPFSFEGIPGDMVVLYLRG